MKTLILDNYDSFTFNLYQEIGALGGNPVVERNDAISIDDVIHLGVTHIVLSPGPGNPYTERDIGISDELIDFAKEQRIPLLGVCLGHQILGKHVGATVSRSPTLFHGKASHVRVKSESRLLAGLSEGFDAMRYHSLCVESETIPSDMRVTALTEDGIVMAMEHTSLPLYGVQFHPESIGTPLGKHILKNFLAIDSASHPDSREVAIEEAMRILLSEKTSEDERQAVFDTVVRLEITPRILYRAAKVLRQHMVPVALHGHIIDTCGTGGSGKKTINTSTLTAFLVAACGGKVAKHGNRSASGNCGSFDLLDHLGVKILLTPEEEQRLFSELRIVFLFAPLHHPAMRLIAPLRKKHGKKTLFNLLGPLCNPASAQCQLLGTGNADEALVISEALRLLGTKRSLVVCGVDGLDEVSACEATTVHEVPSGTRTLFTPSDVGLDASRASEIEGGSPAENVDIFKNLAKGGGTEAHRTLVLVNAAHALVLAGISPTLVDAYGLARETLLSGKIEELFTRYRTLSNQPL